ncbi:hypothetical protein BH23CHL8_BH23CHL8_24290 [soil metagenome]
MGFLRRLLGGTGTPGQETASDPFLEATEATFDAHGHRHRVTVWLRLMDPELENEREQLRVFALEDTVMAGLERSGLGEHDTNSLERSYLALRLVGDDADAIVAVVTPLLRDAPPGSYLAVRRGPAGHAEDRIELGDPGEAP